TGTHYLAAKRFLQSSSLQPTFVSVELCEPLCCPQSTERPSGFVEEVRSWLPSHIFLEAERVQYVQSKLAYEIVAAANSCLGQHSVCTACPYIVSRREPAVIEQAGGESPGIHRDLWAEFALSSVIRDKVS